MNSSYPAIIIFVLISVAISLFVLFGDVRINQPNITSYQECVDAGYPVQESYPEVCVTPDGDSFTRKLSGWENTNTDWQNSSYDTQRDSPECDLSQNPTPQELSSECGCIQSNCEWE